MDDRLKQFRAWDVMDGRREIFCPKDSLPEDDLVFFLLDLIPQLDLTSAHAARMFGSGSGGLGEAVVVQADAGAEETLPGGTDLPAPRVGDLLNQATYVKPLAEEIE